jgi:hypothetical protein
MSSNNTSKVSQIHGSTTRFAARAHSCMHTTFYLCFHNRVVVSAATVLVDMLEDVDGPLCDTHIVSIGLPAICGRILKHCPGWSLAAVDLRK